MNYAVPKSPRHESLRTHWMGITIILTVAVINLAVALLAGKIRNPWLVDVMSAYEDVKQDATIGFVALGLALIGREVVLRLLERRVRAARVVGEDFPLHTQSSMGPQVDLTLLHLQGIQGPMPLVTSRYLPRPTGPSGTVRFPSVRHEHEYADG